MANKKSKGIELEIGGNASGLSKALTNVNKQLGATQKELNQVDRLLKLDPKNTELLAQKQALLSTSIETTEEKLNALKDAKTKADSDMQNGTEVNEKQYRQLQREIVETEHKLADLEESADDASEQLIKIALSAQNAGEQLEKIPTGKKVFSKIKDGFEGVKAKATAAGAAIGTGLTAAGKGAITAAKTVAAGAAAIGAGLFGAAEVTREYREDMNRLETAFITSGKTTEQARKSYSDFYAVLGESDRSVEAVNHLAKLCNSEEELANWSNICAGVSATFGDSLPIEGLTEAANETAKVGKVTGPLADALNWVGISEDGFNEKLTACNSEQERSALITNALTEAYNDAAWQFKQTNAEIMAAREAQAQLDSSMGLLGQTAEGIVSPLKAIAAEGLSSIATGLTEILNGDTEKGLQTINDGVNTFVESAVAQVNRLMEIAEPILTALANAIIQNLPMLIDAAIRIVTMIGQFIMNNLDMLLDAAMNVILQLADGLIAALPVLVPAVVKIVLKIAETLIKNLPKIISAAKDIGVNIIKGLWNGLAETANWLFEKAKGLLKKIKNIFTGKDGFDTHSPSKWAEKVGKFLMQGLANGITADMSAEDALKKKIDNLKSFISDELGINESDVKLADAEYELWSLQNPNASETAKSDKQIGLLMSKITKQSEAVQIVNDALWESKQLTGDNSQESKAYQLQLVQERVALEKLNAEMQKAIAARQQLYRTADDNVGYSALKKVSKNAVSYMRNNNTARKAGQHEGQTVNNVTQNYYGYKGTVSENNAALKKTLKNAEVALA